MLDVVDEVLIKYLSKGTYRLRRC